MLVRTLILAILCPLAVLEAQASDLSAALQLRPGDVVRLQVHKEEALTGDYPIMEEGFVLLPIIGLVQVAGRPFAEVRSEIGARYGRELSDSPVLVTPVLRIAVLGEVQRPGLFPVDPTMTLSEVIASAGGLTARGDPHKVSVLREGDERPFFVGPGAGGGTPTLQPGDLIEVGRRSWVRENSNVLLTAAATVVAAAVTSLIVTSR
jgi:polysaccharide biosynthesis/export protein